MKNSTLKVAPKLKKATLTASPTSRVLTVLNDTTDKIHLLANLEKSNDAMIEIARLLVTTNMLLHIIKALF